MLLESPIMLLNSIYSTGVIYDNCLYNRHFFTVQATRRAVNPTNLLTWGLYYKTLRIRNLRELYKVYSRLVAFSLDKHYSSNKQAH